jgi:hypothetical protein
MTKTLLFDPIQMEELVKKYVLARERRAQLLTCGKVNHVAYKDMERQLLTTMKKLDLHHVHNSRHRCTINSSVADKALRVYPWRTSRLVEDSLDITLAQNIDTFLALRREKHVIQSQRDECDKLLATISEQFFHQVRSIVEDGLGLVGDSAEAAMDYLITPFNVTMLSMVNGS